jgi:hypothetical protein
VVFYSVTLPTKYEAAPTAIKPGPALSNSVLVVSVTTARPSAATAPASNTLPTHLNALGIENLEPAVSPMPTSPCILIKQIYNKVRKIQTIANIPRILRKITLEIHDSYTEEAEAV